MEKSDKKDMYKTGLKRQDAYIVFMASGETDFSLLPEPITQTEKRLYELCKEKADVLKPVNKPEEVPEEEAKEETKTVKRTAKRTVKK